MSKCQLIIGAAFVSFVLAVTAATAQQSNVGGLAAKLRLISLGVGGPAPATPGNITATGTVTASNYVGNVGGVSSSDFARLSQANTFTSNAADGAIALTGSQSQKLKLNAGDAAGDNYIGAYSSDGTTARWYVGNGGTADNTVTLHNYSSGSALNLTTTGGGAVQVNGNEIVRSSAGTYSPTVTNVLNVSGCSSGTTTSYLRVGNTVTVSGVVDSCSAAASGPVGVAVSLPVASNFTVLSDAAGVGAASGSTAIARGVAAVIMSDTANDRVDILSTATASGLFTLFYTFTYTVK
jgi:hypothetical protein